MNKNLLKIFGGWFAVLAQIGSCLVVLYLLLRGEWRQLLYPILWTFGFFLVLFLFALKFPKAFAWLGRTIEAGYEANVKFFFHYLLLFLPVFIFSRISNWLVALNVLWLQILILAIWGSLLFFSIRVLFYEKNRVRFFKWLRDRISGFAPWAYSFNLIWIGVYFFASLTYILAEGGGISFTAPVVDETTLDTYLNFYTWHFLKAIPGFAVTDTLRWTEPLTYDSGLIGLLVLTFKVIIISPIIGAFIWYWRFVGKEEEKEISKRIRKTIYHTYRPRRGSFE